MQTAKNKHGETMAPLHFSATVSAGANCTIVGKARGHEILLDIRKDWGGDDAGPNPPECLGMALGGCVLNLCRIMAREKEMSMDGLSISITGSIDPSRAFGLETENRAGFSEMTVEVNYPSNILDKERDSFHQELIRRCPLCDTIGNPTPLKIVAGHKG